MFANFLCWDIAQLCVRTSVNEQCFSPCPFVYLYTYLCAFIYDHEKKSTIQVRRVKHKNAFALSVQDREKMALHAIQKISNFRMYSNVTLIQSYVTCMSLIGLMLYFSHDFYFCFLSNVCPCACQAVCLSDCQSGCLSVYRSVSLSVSFFVSLSVCQSICQSLCLPVCLSVCLSVYQAVSLSVCLSVCPSLCWSICQSVRQSNRQSVCLSICLSVCMSFCQSIHHSVSLSVILSLRQPICRLVCLSAAYQSSCQSACQSSCHSIFSVSLSVCRSIFLFASRFVFFSTYHSDWLDKTYLVGLALKHKLRKNVKRQSLA